MGVDLHHRQGEGDDHGRIETLGESSNDEQDGSQGEATEDAALSGRQRLHRSKLERSRLFRHAL